MLFTKANDRKTVDESPVAPTFESIPIERIRPNPYQPRRYFSPEAIQELSASIKAVGLIQPITVRRTGENSYELIAGERRLRACKLAGFTEINAVIQSNMVDQDSAMIAMIENLQRENLNYFEEAEGYLSLIREHGFTQEELARRLSKNQSTIANKLRILRLPHSVKKLLISGSLTERHARALLRLHNEQAQLELLDVIIKRSLSVKETEALVEKELGRLYGEVHEAPPVRMRGGYKIYVNTIKRAVKKLEDMGTRAEMSTEDKGDRININIVVPKRQEL